MDPVPFQMRSLSNIGFGIGGMVLWIQQRQQQGFIRMMSLANTLFLWWFRMRIAARVSTLRCTKFWCRPFPSSMLTLVLHFARVLQVTLMETLSKVSHGLPCLHWPCLKMQICLTTQEYPLSLSCPSIFSTMAKFLRNVMTLN